MSQVQTIEEELEDTDVCRQCNGVFYLSELDGNGLCSSCARVAEQAEEIATLRAEVERLTTEYADLKSCHDEHYSDMLALSVENERLREALRTIWDEEYEGGAATFISCRWCGKTARNLTAFRHSESCPFAALADTSRDKTADRGDK